MKLRLARFCAVLLPIMGMVASSAPPAHALILSTITVTGLAGVGPGIAYECLEDGNAVPPVINPAKCYTPVDIINKPSTMNSASFTFTGTGVGLTEKVNKDKCKNDPIRSCVQLANYVITSTGVVKGACGMSNVEGTGSITKSSDIVATKPAANNPPVNFTFKIYGIASLLILTGTAQRGMSNGTLAGVLTATTGQAGIPPGVSGSCLNKAAKTFFVAGATVAVFPNL
jgi:hypothetical protein